MKKHEHWVWAIGAILIVVAIYFYEKKPGGYLNPSAGTM